MKTTNRITLLSLTLIWSALCCLAADAAALTFNDPTVTVNDNFGHSVALDGNNVLIGAYRDDTLGKEDVGQAHLFDAVTGDLLQTFDNPTPTAHELFGESVALDGNNVLIGAFGATTTGGRVGQAYLFDATTGNLLQTFDDPTPTGSDRFGGSVALDGNYVLVGAQLDETFGINVGQAHLFDANTGNLLRTFNDPTPTGDDSFGGSVALDDSYVLISARGGSSVGQAHLFDANTGQLIRTFNDPTVTGGDGFGSPVALDGNNVLIGASADDTFGNNVGQAHLFDAVTGDLLQTFDDPTPTTADYFGWSMALDGNNVIIGAIEDDTLGTNVGQAHLFDALTGNLLRTFDDPTPTTYDFFGYSVAIDSNNILIGASADDTFGNNVGQAHLFTISVPGDANDDGKVDGFDYITWAINFGDNPADDPPGSPGNGDYDDNGVVDGLDYITWASNYGQGPNDGVTVPEPGCLGLVCLSMLAVVVPKRRRR